MIERIDHIVLTVRDIKKTCRFYTQLLGMDEVTFGDGRKALRFGTQKINIHEAGNELEPKALRPTPGSGDICFITKTPIRDLLSRFKKAGVDIVEGPVKRTGAIGPMESLYIRDPDGNLIELSNYL